MLLCIFEIRIREGGGIEPLEDDPRVGRQSRQGSGIVERSVAAAVFGGDRAVAASASARNRGSVVRGVRTAVRSAIVLAQESRICMILRS